MDGQSQVPTVKLFDGQTIPTICLGTFQGYVMTQQQKFDNLVKVVCSAIDNGYRQFDSAYYGGTEQGIGAGIRQKIQEGVVKREDVFITVKLWGTCHRRDLVLPALRRSLANLGMDYVDMFHIHFPVSMPPSDELHPKNEHGEYVFEDDTVDMRDTWQAMEECVQLGLTRYLGLSNFNRRQIQKILDSCTIQPANLQIECNPFLTQRELVDFCHSRGIVVSCYSPLGKPYRPNVRKEDPDVFNNAVIKAIAEKYNKTSTQVVLNFQAQRGLVVIPKSGSPVHQKENIESFDFKLFEDDMQKIYALNKDFRVVTVDSFKGSSEYPFHDDKFETF